MSVTSGVSEVDDLQTDRDRVHRWYRIVLGFSHELVSNLVSELGVSPGQMVLDPFCGTGTTLVECRKLGIITEEEALRVSAARRAQSHRRFDLGYSRSKSSPYLLSGGLFKCGRCGANMTGFRTTSGRYYVCGSQPYRDGMGCGPGVYVPQDQVEAEVVKGMEALIGVCADTQGFTRQANQELRRLWESATGFDRDAERKVREVDAKITNVRQAIEDGLADAAWANERLAELATERGRIGEAAERVGAAPQIDAKAAMSYRAELGKALAQGDFAERKGLVRAWVQEMKLAPATLEVEITYKLPEPVMNCLVARASFVAMHNVLQAYMSGRWRLPPNGRRSG